VASKLDGRSRCEKDAHEKKEGEHSNGGKRGGRVSRVGLDKKKEWGGSRNAGTGVVDQLASSRVNTKSIRTKIGSHFKIQENKIKMN